MLTFKIRYKFADGSNYEDVLEHMTRLPEYICKKGTYEDEWYKLVPILEWSEEDIQEERYNYREVPILFIS